MNYRFYNAVQNIISQNCTYNFEYNFCPVSQTININTRSIYGCIIIKNVFINSPCHQNKHYLNITIASK